MMQPMIEAIGALGIADHAAATGAASPAGEASKFANLLARELGDVSTNVATAESAVAALASGKSVELHDVMISLERARLSVQTFVHVRNKLVESYQDLMRMQM